VHTLKIDRSFIAGLTTQPAQRQVAKTVIGLGTALGLRVVAEGVETTEQLDELRTLGADCVQGFVLSRPLPAPEFEKFIAAHRMGTRLNEM
jgi:EAL domain-containing protein (putative c-di-GMP-specific phosphodiesterase class I)